MSKLLELVVMAFLAFFIVAFAAAMYTNTPVLVVMQGMLQSAAAIARLFA